MQSFTTDYLNAIASKVRRVKAKVELYEGSTLANTYTQDDSLIGISIERVGEEGKFFGFGVTHKANLRLIDVKREKNISTANSFIPMIGANTTNGIQYSYFPQMYVTEVNRDENTNELSITAYDILNSFKSVEVSNVNISAPYTLGEYITACGAVLGVSVSYPEDIEAFTLSYAEGANFEGTEAIYDAFTAAAEATQTIFYVNASGIIVFKRLDKEGAAALTIPKENYITLDSSTNRRLQTICHATELGDNVSASTTLIGTTQYVRDNPFWELREDVDTLVDNALAAMGDITINQFTCEWRGNPALEPGDKIAFVAKDNSIVTSYLLNDTLTFEGGLAETTQWNYTENESETESNPTSLGDALRQTYARVDKANKQVELMVKDVQANTDSISSLILNTDSIAASVQKIETQNEEELNSINEDINTLIQKVDAQITAEDIKLEIQSELSNGVSSVQTNTGFTFNDEGLTVSKSGSEMTTQITEDGMAVYRDSEEVLTADNQGVVAYNLHAKTYLIIGETSRFEDYEKDGETRTGCFWIGETEVSE